jgi:hypothetical protein
MAEIRVAVETRCILIRLKRNRVTRRKHVSKKRTHRGEIDLARTLLLGVMSLSR